MSGKRTIYDPQVVVNGVAWETIPGTLSYKDGRPEQKKSAVTAGAGRSSSVFSEDVSTRISTLKFEMAADPESIKRVVATKDRKDDNTVIVTDPNSEADFRVVFKNACLSTPYESELKHMGKITGIYFEAEPLEGEF